MLRLVFRLLAIFLGVAASFVPAFAEETGLPAKLHLWGRFQPGTWKLVRVVTESLNEQGQVVSTSTTDTKTTLVSIDRDGVTLEVETCIEVAGKRYLSEPQTIRQGFYGETAGSGAKLKDPSDGELLIEDRKVPCKIQHLTVDDSNGKTAATLHYSTTVFPHVLKRAIAVTDPDGTPASETNMDVVALDMPVRVHGAIRVAAYVKTVYKTAKATITTMAVVAPEVPGGVVNQSSKELANNGQPVGRSTLELLDYNSDPDKDHSGLFGRKRPNRRTKQPPHYPP
jgi:hypothetical protein